MKKINLIEWLSRNSHEKQTPQRFARYAAILILLLTLGVGQMWADGTYTVVGMAAPNANDYDVQVTVQVCGDCNNGGAKWFDDWSIKDNKAGITFEGKKLYIASWTDYYNGTNAMYFKEKDGSTQKNYNKVHDSWWGADGYNHKIYQYNESGTSGSWYGVKTMTKGARVYFDASTWDETSIKLVTGHANHQKYDGMSAISNTKLYYGTSSATTWTDAMGWGIVGNTTAETGDNWLTNVSNKASEYTGWKNWSLENAGDNNAYLCVPNGDAGEEPSMSYYATHYNSGALNNTQTIKYAVGINGATPTELTSGYVPADIAISSYKFSSKKYDAVDASSGSVTLSKNGSNYSATVTAARTATTTYTVSNVHEDYSFLGWYSAASGGTLLSSDASYTFYPTSATTAYARFSKENNHTVTISRYCTSTSSEISSTTAKVGEVTYSEISAPVIAGYSFVNWTVGSGLTVKSGDNTNSNPIHVITKASGDYTLTANYTEVLTTDWKLIGDNQSGSPFGDNYAYASGKAMSKKSGYSTSSDAYITLNITHLPASYYGFKVATATGNANSYGWGNIDGAYITFNRSISNTSQQVYNGDQNVLKFIPDALGEYEFRVNYPGNKYVYVTFPTAYAVTYNIGTVAGTSGSISATYSSETFASGTKVQSGKSVTLTAPEPAPGYTWKGWYTNAAGTTGKIDDVSRAITVTVDAAKTLYACYDETTHTVDVSKTGEGSVSPSGNDVVTAGIATASGSISATETHVGYYFRQWTGDIGDGVTIASGTQYTSPITIRATADNKGINAEFALRWALAGSWALNDVPAWNTETYLFDHFGKKSSTKDTAYVELTLPANTDYEFAVVERRVGDYNWLHNSTSVNKMTYASNNGQDWEMAKDESHTQGPGLTTAGAGTYRFAWNITENKVAVWFPKSYTITYGKVANNGQNVGGVSATGDDGDGLASGKYVAKGTATFTANAVSGYRFVDWRTSSTYNSGTQLSTTNPYTMSLIADNKTVYANYAENLCTVTITANNTAAGTITVGGAGFAWGNTTQVGVYTTKELIVTPAAGYYFAGWTLSTSPDFSVDDAGESGVSTNLTGLGGTNGSTGTLTANFVELDKIYFRNIFKDGETVTHWSNVYVYFDYTWDGTKVKTSTNSAYKASMTQIGASDVYWAYVPRAFTSSNGKKVAFSDTEFTTNYTFYNVTASGSKGSARGDYSRSLNMFVPYHEKNKPNDNGVDYFDNGYWMKYDTKASQGAGYYLKKYKSKNNYWQPGEFIATNDDATFIQFRMRVDNISADSTRFMIVSAGGLNYLAASTPTSISYSDIDLNEDTRTLADNTVYFQLTATSEGDYTFIIDQSGDKMKLTVDYPVSPGDYRIRHSYTDGDIKYSYSDIIKKGTTSDKVSMYIRNTSGTLKIAKCSGLDANKKPVWTTGIDVTGYTADNFPKAGVYVFDLALVDGNSADPTVELTSATISNAAPYTGDYYIKTDCAPGGWVNYTQNVLDKNTINASDFDYYFCKNVANQTNVKFVIANDYNIQVTDTIIQDLTYLTTSGGGTSKEYMPESSCIRFSYNSATNEAKRAYLRYSSNNNFLNIIPSAASTVYDAASAGNDLYNSGNANANNKFGNDDGNFVYRKTVYAVSGATIDVNAEYTTSSKKQTFVSGKTLITSNDASERYPVRVVYDFKTNNLTMAWEATTGLTDKLSNTEFLYIRNGQAAASQVSLGDGGEVNNSKVCGVFQFDYNDYVGKVGAWPQQADQTAGYTNSKCMFYFSFPFDVNVSDIFGLGTYGKEWKLQYYDGAERAKKGFFRGDGTTTFWKDVPADSVLTKNVGYSLLLDNDYFNTTAKGMVFEGKSAGGSVFLYFPSSSAITLGQGATSIDVPSHECTLTQYWIDPETSKTLYHSKTDSHWNMMGVPLFQSQNGDYSATFKSVYNAEKPFGYLYEWTPSTNSLDIANTSNFTFQSMNAYMVQYTGTVNFTGSHIPASVAARQKKEDLNYTIDLAVLNSNDKRINHTYVELREGASDNFELNEDVYMTLNGKNVNVYSYAGDYDVAANVLSVANHTVPVGVTVKANGTYKFSMPSNFSGTVTLVDKFAQTRTNLAIEDYEVTLNKGTINDRFELEININKTPTAIDGVESGEGTLKDGKAHKFIMNDMLYIIRDGRIYDATGVLVK